jgi:hypothetical protein
MRLPWGFEHLPKIKQMLIPPCAGQMAGCLLLALFASFAAQCGKLGRVSFPFHDGFDYRRPGLAVYVRNRVLRPDIHLIKAFLHLPDSLRAHRRQGFFPPEN